jgi:hypothetical protein
MNMQEKFQAAMQKIADEHDLDLVVETGWANTGWYSFQPRAAFEPLLRFPYDFQKGYSSFNAAGRIGPLGPNPKGGYWSHVQGGEHELAIARVRALLDGEPDTVRIVVLADGETWGALDGTHVCEVPSWFGAEAIEEALAAGTLDGRELR